MLDTSPEAIAQLYAVRTRDRARLRPWEERWRDKQVFLESRGYKLRARYIPGWVPSWTKNPTLSPRLCEDYHIPLPRPNLMDATRVSDSKLVYIKRVDTNGDEVKIATMLSDVALQDDPNNHCVPILEVFADEADETISYLVMPFMRGVFDPRFGTVDDVVNFVDQILAGLVFLHKHGVAHRDCEQGNLLMDADSLYPEGFHPVALDLLLQGRGFAPRISRRKARVKYYYADFGISSHFPSTAASTLVVGDLGRDKTVPELSLTTPYDPFKVDVYIIGNMFREFLLDEYSNLGFLKPLSTIMTADNPASRPTAAQALKKWRKIRRWILIPKRGWRVRSREEECWQTVGLDLFAFFAFGPWLYRDLKGRARRLLRRPNT